MREQHPKEYKKVKDVGQNNQKIAECLQKQDNESISAVNKRKNKINISRKLAILAAESYIPVNALVGKGFTRFLSSVGVDTRNYPTDRNILETSLDDVYLLAMETVKKTIQKECPNVLSISTDTWTDSHLGKSYINYNLIYAFDQNLRTILLETAPFKEKKTGANLLKDLKRVAGEFGLLKKKIVLVSDGASNNDACFEESLDDPEIDILFRVRCINHKIHNLIYNDVLDSSHYKNLELNVILRKIKKIQRAVYYRKVEIEKKIIEKHSRDIWTKILTFIDTEAEDDFEEVLEEIDKHSDIHKMLKKNNVTRWSSTLSMIRSFLPLATVINEILCQDKKVDLLVSDKENMVLKELETVFKIFEDVTKTFQVCGYRF